MTIFWIWLAGAMFSALVFGTQARNMDDGGLALTIFAAALWFLSWLLILGAWIDRLTGWRISE